MKNKSHLTAFLFILAIIIFAASCGGGGGGGGSVVSFGNNSKPHNGGDAGGWGNGAQNGNGFGGNGGGIGSGNDSNVVITGSTPLEVGTYNYNGASYDSVEALYAALAANTLEDVFYVDFQVEGESTPRKARVTANGKSNDGNDILIEHQYKALFPDENGGTQEVLFYKRDGIELPGGSGSVNIDGFEFEKGWQIDGSFAPAGSIIGVASGGDVDLQDRAVLKTAVYGYKADTGASGGYILGFNTSALTSGDTVTVTTDRQITKLQLPSTSINLDLSGATNFKTVNLTADNPGNLTSITLPSNAETIAMSAFSGCTNLNSVTLPSTLTSIQTEAFLGCSNLQSITIPAGVTSLADDTFKNCSSLSSVTFAPGSQLTTINKRVFEGCSSLVLSTLPSSVDTIGEDAFASCTSLTSFTIPDGVTQLKGTFQNCSNLASISIPSSVNTLQENVFNGVKNDCVLTFNSTGGPISLGTALPSSDFKVKLTGTGIPINAADSNSLFRNNTNLTSVEIGENITGLQYGAFFGCTNLETVTFSPSSTLSTISANAFYRCSISSIELPNGVTTIERDAFYDCSNLASITIPANVTSIGSAGPSTPFSGTCGSSVSGGCTLIFKGNQTMTTCVLPNADFNVVLQGGVPQYISGGAPESIFKDEQTLKSVVYAGGYTLIANAFTGCSSLTTVTFQSYPTVIQTTPLPDNVHNIIIGLGQTPIENVKDVGNLFPSTMNYSSLTVTFENGSSSIRIKPNAFNFTGAENIIYQFSTDPPDTNMIYDDGTCFKSVPVPAHTGAYIWTSESVGSNGSIGRWQ